MLIVSDTNILSSFSAGGALDLLLRLFSDKSVQIPPAVEQELSQGLTRGQDHLKTISQAISEGKIQVLNLSAEEKNEAETLPARLNAGEREAIALTRNRNARLLCNDKQAIRYCEQNNIQVLDLPFLLRQLWVRNISSQHTVDDVIHKMRVVESLQLSPKALKSIFSPR